MRFTWAILGLVIGTSVFAQSSADIAKCGAQCQQAGGDQATIDACIAKCPVQQSFTDERNAFKASVYIGEVIDTFAADEVVEYLNPEDANKSTMRVIAGADFEYRLFNWGTRKAPADTRARQLWVYGETIHGVRSRDVDCKEKNNQKLPVCSGTVVNPNAGPDEFIAILRGASSLEAFVGFRYEFPPPLQNDTDSPARMYVNTQFGFLTVSGGGGDVLDDHHIGLGAKAVGGRFEGSFLEVGYGQSDLFIRNPDKRCVIDGMLSIDPKAIGTVFGALGRLRPFIEFTGNFDLGSGSDSIQTWLGFDYEFK